MDDKTSVEWNELRRLADELELKVHLAGMEVRDRWAKLQPQLAELRQLVEQTGQRTAKVVGEQLATLGRGLRQLRDELADHGRS